MRLVHEEGGRGGRSEWEDREGEEDALEGRDGEEGAESRGRERTCSFLNCISASVPVSSPWSFIDCERRERVSASAEKAKRDEGGAAHLLRAADGLDLTRRAACAHAKRQ